MSAIAQPKAATPKAAKPKGPTWLMRLTDAIGRLDSQKDALGKALAGYATITVEIGSLLVEHYGAYGAEPYKKDSTKKEILSRIESLGMSAGQKRTNEKDQPFSWGYVYSWIKAGTIRSKLAEQRPDLVEKMDQFSADAFGKIATLESKKDLETAVAFAVERLDKGQTSNRAVRAAFEEVIPPASRGEKTLSQKAGDLEKKIDSKLVASVNASLARVKIAPNTVMAALKFAVLCGVMAKDAEVGNQMVLDLLKAPTPKKVSAKK